MTNSYREDIVIDKFDLDTEWELLPIRYLHWAEIAIDAQHFKDCLENVLKVIEAELDKDIRSNPNNYGLTGKITDKAINSIIITHSKFQNATNNLLTAIKNAKLLTVAEKSFEYKKKSLERLTDFYFTGYYTKSSSIANDFMHNENMQQHINTLKNNPRVYRRKKMEST